MLKDEENLMYLQNKKSNLHLVGDFLLSGGVSLLGIVTFGVLGNISGTQSKPRLLRVVTDYIASGTIIKTESLRTTIKFFGVGKSSTSYAGTVNVSGSSG